MKKSFALFVTIVIVTTFGYLSTQIIQTQTLSSNINSLKYLYLQANIHLEYIINYIKTHTTKEIEAFILKDDRFQLNIIKEDNKYHIIIKSNYQLNIRLYSFIIK